MYFNAEGDLAPHRRVHPAAACTGMTRSPGRRRMWRRSRDTRRSVVKTTTGANIPRTAWYGSEVINGTMPSLELEAPYYTTRDGQFLLFGPYRYDAADGSVVCVMCNPNGSGPIPDASFTRSAPRQGQSRGWAGAGDVRKRGIRVLRHAESLVPQDTNGTLDVYEWQTSRRTAISLISSGQDPKNSYFLGSSSCVSAQGETVEGCNVFFGTHAKLVPEDTDNSGDLYDARIGGGFRNEHGRASVRRRRLRQPPAAPARPVPRDVHLHQQRQRHR